MANVYNIEFQHQVQEEQVGFPLGSTQVLPYNHMPYLIPILKLIVTPDYVTSFIRWDFFMALVFIASITIFGWMLKKSGMDQASILTAAMGGLLFLPVFVSLMNGQDTSILLLGASIWMYGLLSGKETVAGLGLGLTTIRPHIALILALPMVIKHFKTFLVFCIFSGSLALFSFAILGVKGTQEFISLILVSAGGDWYGIKQDKMFNLIGLLIRSFPALGIDTIRTIGWIVYGLTIIALTLIWSLSKGRHENLIGFTGAVTPFVVPHLHFHDLSLLLVPIFAYMYLISRKGLETTSTVSLLPIAISFILLLSNSLEFLQFLIPYLIIFAFAYYHVRGLSSGSANQVQLNQGSE
jgi:hypothetical protein